MHKSLLHGVARSQHCAWTNKKANELEEVWLTVPNRWGGSPHEERFLVSPEYASELHRYTQRLTRYSRLYVMLMVADVLAAITSAILGQYDGSRSKSPRDGSDPPRLSFCYPGDSPNRGRESVDSEFAHGGCRSSCPRRRANDAGVNCLRTKLSGSEMPDRAVDRGGVDPADTARDRDLVLAAKPGGIALGTISHCAYVRNPGKPRMQRIPICYPAFLFLALLVGCEDEVRTPGSITGEYVTARANGEPLPMTIRDSTSVIKMVRYIVTLREDGTFSTIADGRITVPGGKPEPDQISQEGRFELRGPKGDSILLTTQHQAGDPRRGVLKGEHMTVEIANLRENPQD